jgi:hypothetical protein
VIELTADISGFFRERLETALDRHGIEVSPPTSAYLLNLLVDFGSTPLSDGWEGTFVERMATAAHAQEPQERLRRFRELGDRSLYTCGFFADHLERRGLARSYVVTVGERAYEEAGSLAKRPWVAHERNLASVYPELATRFESVAHAFDDVRECTDMRTPQQVIRLYEKWKRTGSQLIAERLEEEGLFPQKTLGEDVH